MSTQPVPVSTETYREKATRKFKEQPLVPLGALATTVALVMAAVKMKSGQSQSMNTWLRARVVAQGFTIVAIVAGTYTFTSRGTREAEAEKAREAGREKREEGRKGFEERMKAAEQLHKVEEAAAKGEGVPPPLTPSVPPASASAPASAPGGSSWFSWARGGGKSDSGKSDEKPSS